MSYLNVIGREQQAVGLLAAAPAKAADNFTSTVGQGEAVEDQAKISASAGLLTQALSGSDVRSSKIEALQQSIAAGTYNVPAGDVADKLIQALTK